MSQCVSVCVCIASMVLSQCRHFAAAGLLSHFSLCIKCNFQSCVFCQAWNKADTNKSQNTSRARESWTAGADCVSSLPLCLTSARKPLPSPSSLPPLPPSFILLSSPLHRHEGNKLGEVTSIKSTALSEQLALPLWVLPRPSWGSAPCWGAGTQQSTWWPSSRGRRGFYVDNSRKEADGSGESKRERRWRNGSVPPLTLLKCVTLTLSLGGTLAQLVVDICAASVSGCLDANNNGRESAWPVDPNLYTGHSGLLAQFKLLQGPKSQRQANVFGLCWLRIKVESEINK